MSTHADPLTGQSQCDIILAELTRRSGQWVDMLHLHRLSGAMAVHSRISDLRARGLTIEQRNEKRGRMQHSFYRLIPATKQSTLDL